MDATAEQRRPTSVVLFEALNVFSALAIMLLWDEGSPFGELVEFLFVVGLTLWVTRGRSRLARGIYTGLALFAVAGLLAAIGWGYVPSRVGAMAVAAITIQCIVFLTLLWSPSTTAWLRARDIADMNR